MNQMREAMELALIEKRKRDLRKRYLEELDEISQFESPTHHNSMGYDHAWMRYQEALERVEWDVELELDLGRVEFY